MENNHELYHKVERELDKFVAQAEKNVSSQEQLDQLEIYLPKRVQEVIEEMCKRKRQRLTAGPLPISLLALGLRAHLSVILGFLGITGDIVRCRLVCKEFKTVCDDILNKREVLFVINALVQYYREGISHSFGLVLIHVV